MPPSSRTKEAPPAPEPLPHPVVDNHCHLDTAREHGGGDVTGALAASAEVGVPRIVQIGCDLDGSRFAVETATAFDRIVAGVALHPNEAPRHADGRLPESLHDALTQIERLAATSDRVRAIGETGLDYFRTGDDGRPAQEESFRAHIELATRLDKTLVIHDRDAHADILRVLDDAGTPERTVMHCFSGDAGFAAECLDRGAYLSFAGTVTFKNADYLRDALRLAPRERILVETDAPFLTPMPYRGQLNASYLIPVTVRFMAEVLGADLEQLCRDIEANTFEAFGGAW